MGRWRRGARGARFASRVVATTLALITVACAPAPPGEDALLASTTTEATGTDPRDITVRIRSSGCAGVGVGTGFVLDGRWVVTNRHVVEGASEIDVETQLGERLEVATAQQARLADLAILRLAAPRTGTFRLAGADPEPDDHITVLGYSWGEALRTTEGRVTSSFTDLRYGNLGKVLRANVEVHPGNSGGPAVDGDGRVVGVVYAYEISTKNALIVPRSTLAAVFAHKGDREPVEGC